MNKKGGVLGWFLTVLPDLLIPIILLVILFLILSPFLTKIIAPSSSKDAAKQSFNSLIEKITPLLESPNDFENDMIFYKIPEGYRLVGFDADSSITNLQSNSWIDKLIRGSDAIILNKPDRCMDFGCLCLYDKIPSEIEENKEDGVVICKTFEQDIRFLGYLNESPVLEQGDPIVKFSEDDIRFERLYLGSKMYTDEGEKVNVLLGGGEFYVEKLRKGNIVYLIITPHKDKLESHINTFRPCPDNSESKCKGKPYGWAYHNDTQDKDYACIYSERLLRCEQKELLQGQCEERIHVSGRCRCGDEMAAPGDICVDGEVLDKIRCDSISSCADYCSWDGCEGRGEIYCNLDPCSINCNFVDLPSALGGEGGPACTKAYG